MLDNYLLAFSKLRVDKNRKSWTKLTNHCSPYKPFLLLSVMDLIAGGGIGRNFVEPTIDLTETWHGYIDLLSPILPPPGTAEKLPPPEKVRDQGFRKAIVQLYEYRCALCGIKVITEENHTIVDAAHIIPWSRSHDDRVTNGMALCKTGHWSFDKGLMAVDKEYQVLVSPSVKRDPNLPGHMMTLSNRPMIRPSDSRFWPSLDNLKWHHGQRFRRKQ